MNISSLKNTLFSIVLLWINSLVQIPHGLANGNTFLCLCGCGKSSDYCLTVDKEFTVHMTCLQFSKASCSAVLLWNMKYRLAVALESGWTPELSGLNQNLMYSWQMALSRGFQRVVQNPTRIQPKSSPSIHAVAVCNSPVDSTELWGLTEDKQQSFTSWGS